VVSGLDLTTYWVANFSWDMINYTLPAIVAIIIFVAFDLPAYTGSWKGLLAGLLAWTLTLTLCSTRPKSWCGYRTALPLVSPLLL